MNSVFPLKRCLFFRIERGQVMSNQIAGFIGLYGGALMGLLGLFIGRVKARKERGLDELHDHIWQKSRSIAWYATLISIYILFSLHLFGFSLTVSSVLGMLMIVHIGTWGIGGAFLSFLLFTETKIKISDFVVGILIIISSVILFTTLTIVTQNWLFFLMTIPFSFVGYLFIHQ